MAVADPADNDVRSMMAKLSDDELYARVIELWPRIEKMLCETIEAIEDEMEKSIDSDDAFNLINWLMLREVFWRKTILIALKRDDTEDIPAWIEELYNDWNAEAEKWLREQKEWLNTASTNSNC